MRFGLTSTRGRSSYRLFQYEIDLKRDPLTAKEIRFVQFHINRLILTIRAQQWGLYRSPS